MNSLGKALDQAVPPFLGTLGAWGSTHVEIREQLLKSVLSFHHVEGLSLGSGLEAGALKALDDAVL